MNMMQANELSIGNLVKWKNEETIETINVIAEKTIGLESDIPTDTLTPLAFFEPIPLTEEWLLNHEFEHNIEQEIFNRYDICLSYSDKYKGFKLYVNHEYEIGKPMLYLHQFQNLYFDLEHKKFNT